MFSDDIACRNHKNDNKFTQIYKVVPILWVLTTLIVILRSSRRSKRVYEPNLVGMSRSFQPDFTRPSKNMVLNTT